MDNNQLSRKSTDRSDLVSEDGKNSKSVVCQRCGSKVLCPGMAVFAEKEVLDSGLTDSCLLALDILSLGLPI